MVFHLYTFKTIRGQQVATRGRSPEEARRYLEKICGYHDLTLLGHNVAHAAFAYSRNHPFDWFKVPPLWLSGKRKLTPNNPRQQEKYFPFKRLTQYMELTANAKSD